MIRARDIPARDRLLARLVIQPNGCMHWTGIIDKSGYGRIGYKGRRSETIQRAVYDHFVGPIPDGHDVDHTCHNADPECVRRGAGCLHRRCGNPAHLEAVPSVVNSQRVGGRLTECVNGHPYTSENSYRPKRGRRICVACYTARQGHPPTADSPLAQPLTTEGLAARAARTWATRGRQPCGTRAAYRRGCRCPDCVQANRDRREVAS